MNNNIKDIEKNNQEVVKVEDKKAKNSETYRARVSEELLERIKKVEGGSNTKTAAEFLETLMDMYESKEGVVDATEIDEMSILATQMVDLFARVNKKSQNKAQEFSVQLGTLKKEIETLETDKNTKIEELEGKNTTLKSLLADEEQKVKDLKSEKRELKKKDLAHVDEVIRLDKEIASFRGRVNERDNTIQKLQDKNRELTNELNKNTTELNSIQNELNEYKRYKALSESRESEIATLNQIVKEKENAFNKYVDKIEKVLELEVENKKIKEEVEMKNKENSELTKSIGKVEGKLEIASENYDKVVQELADLKKELDELKTKNSKSKK